MGSYSDDYDVFATIVDDDTDVEADWGNLIQSCIEDVQRALGLNPQGGFATVDARLTALEAIVS